MISPATRKRGTDRLSDRSIKAWLATSPAVGKKLGDGLGLYLTRTPAGTPSWRIKYLHDGKERVYSVGTYPDVQLAEARRKRAEVREMVRSGIDPVEARREHRTFTPVAPGARVTFAEAAAAWLEKRKADWSDIHHEKSARAIERDILPHLGHLPLDSITPPMVAAAIAHVSARGAHDTASKTLWHVVAIFRLGKVRQWCSVNPALDIREELTKKIKRGKRPALLNFDALRDVLQRTDTANISPAVRLALRLVAFTAQRIGNVVTAQWQEFELDGDDPTWTIPRESMKVKDRDFAHRVLLGPTIAAELRAWRKATGGHGYVFPSPTYNPKRSHISREALEKVYRVTLKLSKVHSVHGWRSAFSTLAKDEGHDAAVVDLALDHVHGSAVARAYDRGERLEQRRKLMTWWDAQLSQRSEEG